ncbi:MAG: hypothetical protein AAGB93_21640, partial [Planctomycetota bacterium]
RGRGDSAPSGPAGRIWRRDGAAGAATSSRRGSRRGGPRRGGRDDRAGRGERVDLKKLNAAAESTANNPFAKFFSKDEPAPPAPPEPRPEPRPEESKQAPPAEQTPAPETPAADAPPAGAPAPDAE